MTDMTDILLVDARYKNKCRTYKNNLLFKYLYQLLVPIFYLYQYSMLKCVTSISLLQNILSQQRFTQVYNVKRKETTWRKDFKESLVISSPFIKGAKSRRFLRF